MNWNAISFDWNQVRAFLATVEEGSLSAAARALNVTQPTLSRQVSSLEEALGVILFERGPRNMTLTGPGEMVLEHVRDMASAATRLSLAASGQSQSVKGIVRIAATNTMSTYHLPPVIKRIRKIAPDIELIVTASNSVQDLTRREADIAIRHGRPQQSELIAKLVAETEACLYASQDYLDQLRHPTCAADLADAHFIGFEFPEQMIPFFNGVGIPVSRDNIPVTTSSGTATIEMVRQGLGIALLTTPDAALFPDLKPVLPDMAFQPIPVWLVTHKELNTSPRIRIVFDEIARALIHYASAPHS